MLPLSFCNVHNNPQHNNCFFIQPSRLKHSLLQFDNLQKDQQTAKMANSTGHFLFKSTVSLSPLDSPNFLQNIWQESKVLIKRSNFQCNNPNAPLRQLKVFLFSKINSISQINLVFFLRLKTEVLFWPLLKKQHPLLLINAC